MEKLLEELSRTTLEFVKALGAYKKGLVSKAEVKIAKEAQGQSLKALKEYKDSISI